MPERREKVCPMTYVSKLRIVNLKCYFVFSKTLTVENNQAKYIEIWWLQGYNNINYVCYYQKFIFLINTRQLIANQQIKTAFATNGIKLIIIFIGKSQSVYW